MSEPVIIRASSLPSWPQCDGRGAAQLFRKLILAMGYKLAEPRRSIAAAVGTAVHKSASTVLEEVARGRGLPAATVAEDAAVDELKMQIGDGDITFDEKGPTFNRDDALRQSARMARLYRSVIAPTKEPLLVEERREAEVAPGLILSGQADIVARNPNGIDDTKTGVKLGVYGAQVGAYGLIYRSNGVPVEKAGIDFIPRTPMKKPQALPIRQDLPIGVAEHEAREIVNRIVLQYRAFTEGDEARGLLPGDTRAFPKNPATFLCGPKWCTAYGREGFCEAWRLREGR